MKARFTLTTIRNAVSECDRHRQKLLRSLTLLGFFPLTSDSYKKLEEEQIEHIDQMIYRFTKLQDAMGRKLLPALYAELEAADVSMPFIDILNNLEKLQVIDRADDWQELRILRNELTHEYPDQEDAVIHSLNMLQSRLGSFIAMYEKVREVIVNKSLLEQQTPFS